MRVPFQIAFLTGQSHPLTAALSPSQTAFLGKLSVPESLRITRNFPYPDDASTHRFMHAPLLIASLRNGWQYFASRRAAFAEQHRPAVETLLERADRTLFLAGSCGLELFNNLGLPASALRRVTIFAYGPVARWRPDCACLLVQGRRDWISRRYFGAVDAHVNGGHMDYLTDPAVVALARETVRCFAAQTGTLSVAP